MQEPHLQESDFSIYTEVRKFVADWMGADLDQINAQTRLCQDLGIAGDDGENFMMDFQRAFDVDLTGFRTDDYFGEELSPLIPLNPLVWFFPSFHKLRKMPRNETGGIKMVPITVKDLCKAAATKTWPNLSTRTPE